VSAIRVLASELAYARAGYGDRPGYFARSGKESPAEARDMLLALWHLVDTAKRIRAEMVEARESVRDQCIAALLQEEIETAVADFRRFLSRVARRGGRGLLHDSGAEGRAPLGAAAPSAGGALMAHGCAAFDSAVGPALRAGQDGEVAPHADPLLSCQQWQDLPAAATADNTQSRVGGGVSHDICI